MKKTFVVISIIAVIGLCGGFWFYQKHEVEKRIVAELEAFKAEHSNVKITHEGISVHGFPFHYSVQVENPHITWINTTGFTLDQAPEVYLKGQLTFSADAKGKLDKASIDGELHLIFDLPTEEGALETKHIVLNGEIEEQVALDWNFNRNDPISSLVESLKTFSFGNIEAKNLTISAYKGDNILKLIEIDQGKIQLTLVDSDPNRQKLTLKTNYSGKIFNDNLYPLLYNRPMPLFDKYKVEKSTQSLDLILEMPRVKELESLFKDEFDPTKIPEFAVFVSANNNSEIYKSKATLTFVYKKDGIADRIISFKTDANIFYTSNGKELFKHIFSDAIKDAILNQPPSEDEKDPAAEQIQNVFKKVVVLPKFTDLFGVLPDSIKYDVDLDLKFLSDPLLKDTTLEVKNFSIETPKSGLKLKLANRTVDYSPTNFKALLDLHNPKAILDSHIAFYNRLADLLNPILAKEEGIAIKNLPNMTPQAEEDLVKILREFSDNPESTEDLTLTFTNDPEEGFKIGSKSALEMFVALFGFYNQHLVIEQ